MDAKVSIKNGRFLEIKFCSDVNDDSSDIDRRIIIRVESIVSLEHTQNELYIFTSNSQDPTRITFPNDSLCKRAFDLILEKI